MKKSTLLMALIGAICLIITTAATAQNTPRIYILMQNGKLSEMINGKKEAVTKDITIPNGTTIHPDGNIDDRDGNKKLNEGEYMTMDGKIRLLKDMGGAAKPATGH